MSYGNILVVLDGSPSAEAAAGMAGQLAERVGGTLHVVGVVHPDGAPFELGAAAPTAEPGSPEYSEHLRQHVAEVARAVEERHSCAVVSRLVGGRDPDGAGGGSSDAVARYETDRGVGLTVVGILLPQRDRKRAQAEIRRFRRDVMRVADVPLLLLPVTERELRDEVEWSISDPATVVVAPAAGDDGPSLHEHGAALAQALEVELRVLERPAGREAPGVGRVIAELDDADSGPGTVALGPAGRPLAEQLRFEQEYMARDGDGGSRASVLLCPSSAA